MLWGTPTDGPELPLLGRARELGALEAALDTVGDHGSVFVLRGDPGVGKSALLRAARSAASDRGFLTLQTVGVAAESGLPFAGLHCLLRPLMTRVGELPSPQRAVLHAAFDALGREVGDPFLVALAALGLLSARALEQPVLVVADDLHLMDSNSREVFGFVARRIGADQIVVLAAVANDFDEHAGDLGLPLYDLGPIEAEAAHGLIDARAPGLARLVRRRLLAEAAGNPLALHELPAWAPTLAAAGKAYPSELLPVSPRLQQAFTRSLRNLPRETVLLLLLSAADPAASTSEILAAGTLLTGTFASVASLQPAIDAGLVALDGVDVRFRHPLVRSAIYQSADVEQRRLVHRALADVLSAHPDRCITHRADAGIMPDGAFAQEVEDAALEALQHGAVARAAMWFALAADLSVASRQCVARLLRSAELASELGQADVVRALCEQLRHHQLQARDLARVAWLSAGTDAPRDNAGIIELVEFAEQAAADDDPDLSLELLLTAATRCWWAAASPGICRRVVATLARVPAARTDPRCLAAVALCEPINRAAAVTADLDLASTGIPPRAAHLKMTASHALGDYRATASSFAATAQGLRREGRLGLLAQNLCMHALHALQSGDWTGSADAAAEAVQLADGTGQSAWGALAVASLSALAGARGQEKEAGAYAAAAAARLELSPTAAGLAWLQTAKGLTALTAGRSADAYDELLRIFEPGDPAWHPRTQYMAIGLLADAAATGEHPDDALMHLETLEVSGLSSAAPALRARLVYARAMLAGDEASDVAFTRALEHPQLTGLFERARLQLAYGAWLRRRKRLVEARDALRAARDGFEALTAAPWSARARHDLRAAGEQCPASRREAAGALSDQELVIARLAAEGLSNREIGQKLYLSHRTIASNLYRMFPKLGVTSRGQLPSVVPGLAGARAAGR